MKTMKQLTLLLVLAMVTLMATAQDERDYRERDYRDEDEMGTILSKSRSNGGYGALSFSFTDIEGKEAFLIGARGSWVIDHAFAIGLGGYGFINDIDRHDWMDNEWDDRLNNNLAGGYGGIFLEPIVGPRLPVHLSFPVLLGVGGIARVSEQDYWEDHWIHDDSREDAFLVVEPAVELEFNLTRHVRMAGTVSYRFTSDIKMEETDPEVLEGFNMGLILKFGKF